MGSEDGVERSGLEEAERVQEAGRGEERLGFERKRAQCYRM
jgi:hypothetical protein